MKGAAANNATVRQQGGQQVVSFSPANLKSPSGQAYTVTGYVNGQNLVTKVETRVDNAVAGDLLVEFEYSNYQNMNGVQVPTRIVQRQAGMQTFDANITSATPNPPNLSELLTPPPRTGGARRAAAPAPLRGCRPPPVERIGEGVFKIGGNYASLAIDMGDHILVVESGQNDARGLAVMAAAKQAIPNKPIRFVVNSHPHFDHAGGLARGGRGRRHDPDAPQQRAGPRAAALRPAHADRRQPVRRCRIAARTSSRASAIASVRKGTNGKVVELHRIPNEHSDGMLAVYLPAEKALWTADITVVNPTPAQLGVLKSAVDALNRLKIDYNAWIPAHPPNPDRPLTQADVIAAAGTGGN